MNSLRLPGTLVATMVFALSVTAAPYLDLNKKFNRIKSSVMVRKIDTTTMANLDYAAYNANPVRFDPMPNNPKAPRPAPTVTTLTFDGTLSQTYDALDKTPLTPAEKAMPLAWIPLQNRLWEVVKTDAFGALSSKINSEKWGDPSIFQPFQEMVALYLHKAGDSTEFYVRIDVAPWVTFIKGIKDDDKDGLKNFYGKLSLGSMPADSLSKAITWINDVYRTKVLNRPEMIDWITALASYWYPSLNTDILEMGGQTTWPTAETEPEIAKEIKGLVVKDFLAVVRGRPLSNPIYNIYVVPPQAAGGSKPATTSNTEISRNIGRDTTTSKNFIENNARFETELKNHGGSYAAWSKAVAPLNDSLTTMLKILPPAQMGFKGKGDWLFFRKSVDYLLGGNLSNQPADKNPLTNLVAFKKLCDSNNINILFVPIPNKEEIYYDQLPFTMPKGVSSYSNPFGRKLLKDLQSAGIEVIDVLPLLTAAKADAIKNKSPEDIYQHQDTHWTNGGLQVVAKAIANRIKAYSWYGEAAKTKQNFTSSDTTFSRKGDIVERLPENEQQAFPAVSLRGQQVKNADGSLYKNDKSAPILLMGDSFTGVFESVDCKSAGVGAHIALSSGLPVEIITSWGGGPGVRQKALRAHKNGFAEKRLIIYMMVARDLYNYSQGWEPLDK